MFFIFDTETTGLPKNNWDFSDVYMTQIGYIITDGKRILHKDEYYIKGNYEIPQKIIKLNGITKEMTDKEGKSFQEVFNIIDDILSKYKCKYIIAHNVKFDTKMFSQEYKRLCRKKWKGNIFKLNPIDSKNIFENHFKKNNIYIKNNRLQTIITHFELDYEQSHTALDDCRMLYKCLSKINGFKNF